MASATASVTWMRRVIELHRPFTLAVPLALATLLALIGLLAVPAPRAYADADPASDVLLAQNAFLPYQPPAPADLSTILEKLLSSAAKDGLPLKVAVIGAPEDLGAVPDFFGHPQAYAHFLDREISFNHRQALLVVMPAGFAAVAAGAPTALTGVPLDAKHSTFGLTVSAIHAVVALAHAGGHALATPALPSAAASAGGGDLRGVLIFAVPALLLIFAGIATLRSGGASHKEQPPGATPA